MKILPVILCGGAGTRLWPLSREQHPKQLLALQGEVTLLQATARRLDGIKPELEQPCSPIVVCNAEYRFMVAEQLRAAGVRARAIIPEPAGKGTAPALTLAALHARAEGDPILLAMPSDHLIGNLPAFLDAVARGASFAEQGMLVTFGVPAVSPETGYGYIHVGEEVDPGWRPSAHRVESFVEKPDAVSARKYVASNAYLWNSGIFALRASTWLRMLAELRPDILDACERAYRGGRAGAEVYAVDAEAFAACPEDSIDCAVMERLGRVAQPVTAAVVVRLEAGWSDVGAWDALWQVGRKDYDGNVMRGDVCAVDAHDSLVLAQHRLVACVGLSGVVVVETPDAVLVTRRDKVQKVKEVVTRLKSGARPECVAHRKVQRPWGSYDSVDFGERFQVKRIVVHPGAALSLQKHFHRAEHWVVVRGTARVTRDEEVFLLTENQSTYIPVGVTHRLENPGRLALEIIEVQSGAYLGEDDIVRYDDAYGRVAAEAAGAAKPVLTLATDATREAEPGSAPATRA